MYSKNKNKFCTVASNKKLLFYIPRIRKGTARMKQFESNENMEMSNEAKLKTLSKEHREKLSEAKLGIRRTDDTRAKIKETQLGKDFEYFKESHPEVPKSSMSRSHLTAADVKDIRDQYSNERKASLRKLAKKYNVSRHTIHSIVHYKIWK